MARAFVFGQNAQTNQIGLEAVRPLAPLMAQNFGNAATPVIDDRDRRAHFDAAPDPSPDAIQTDGPRAFEGLGKLH